MIKTMKKSLVLAAAVAALSAVAVPSMASAATWSPLNTYHALSSPSSLTFNVPGGIGPYSAGFTCSSGPAFPALVRTPASSLLEMVSMSTVSCSGTGVVLSGCNVALTTIPLPVWTVDGTSTTNVKINSVNIELAFSGSCGVGTSTAKVAGTLAGGVWSNLNRSLAFTNGTGLNITLPYGTFPLTVTASEFIKDTTSPFLSLP